MRWAPPPGTPPHDVPQPFLLAMRSRDWAWWRPLFGLLLFAVVYFVLAAATAVAAVLGLLASGSDPGVLPGPRSRSSSPIRGCCCSSTPP